MSKTHRKSVPFKSNVGLINSSTQNLDRCLAKQVGYKVICEKHPPFDWNLQNYLAMTKTHTRVMEKLISLLILALSVLKHRNTMDVTKKRNTVSVLCKHKDTKTIIQKYSKTTAHLPIKTITTSLPIKINVVVNIPNTTETFSITNNPHWGIHKNLYSLRKNVVKLMDSPYFLQWSSLSYEGIGMKGSTISSTYTRRVEKICERRIQYLQKWTRDSYKIFSTS